MTGPAEASGPGQGSVNPSEPGYRAYRAACPNCGAPVLFRSAASASAVCGYCRSTLVREGEALRRIGQSAELFDDHSPLQLGARGSHQGEAFTLVGRVQYAYAQGRWTEWLALFDNARSAWLSEDNGAYVLAFDQALTAPAPAREVLFTGQAVQIAGQVWSIASITDVRLHAAEGELPGALGTALVATATAAAAPFTVVDLRSPRDEVGTLDYRQPSAPQWSVGRAVRLADLKLSGLKESASEKTLAGRSIECPHCGTSLEIQLQSTQSVTCGQCRSVVDLSAGVGADLQHYQQHNAVTEPQIPLGQVGQLRLGTAEALPWQVVGHLERCDLPEPGSDEGSTFWREYLLYHPREGFVFLVDTEEGWSWAKPLTGVPVLKGESATWRGAQYTRRWHYRAKTTYVLGEFYWQVQREDVVQVSDFEGSGANRHKRLSREQTGASRSGASGAAADAEVTWSAGEVLDAAKVAKAFGLQGAQAAALNRDTAPLAGGSASGGSMGWVGILVLILVVLVVILLITRCGEDRCDSVRQAFGPQSAEYQQCVQQRGHSGSSGGSWGGFSSSGSGGSSGGHK